ncbi:hypothetical protein EMST110833_13370 [Empedobacter stercoris]
MKVLLMSYGYNLKPALGIVVEILLFDEGFCF